MKHIYMRRATCRVNMRKTDSLNAPCGFSLVELLVAIVILGIVVSIAVPNMNEMARSYQVTSKAAYWMNTLNYARSEAAKRGQRVTLCPSSNGSSCLASSNLHSGWIAFVDLDNDAVVDVGESVFRSAPADDVYTFVLSGTANTYISFVSNGMTKTIGNASWSGNILICRGVGAPGRQVTISPVGRSKIGNVGC